MSVSPRPDPDSPHNPLLLHQDRSNASLANLLAQSYAETEALRRELNAYKQRAIKAERLLDSIRTINKTADDAALDGHIFPPEPITRMILDFEDRALKAERAKEEADSRRRAVQENWQHIESYLAMLESRFQDARSTFSRILAEGPAHLSLPTVPSYAPATNQQSNFSGAFPSLPPHPGRRPRTPSLDSSSYAGQPPAKRARGDSDDRNRRDRNLYPDPSQNYVPHPSNFDVRDESRTRREPRLIRPPGHRSRSRSISAGSSVDDFFHQATGDSNGTNGVHAESHHRAQSNLSRRNVDDRRSLIHPHSTLPPQNTYPSLPRSHPDSPPYPAIRSVHEHHHGPPPQAGPVQPCQTHVFAPVVTGAPPKKQKYTPGATPVGNIGSIETPPAPAPPVAAFPPTNAEGQRICRQCGMPGRYRDGKCVEKWGPGPMGPGTVCDRCRKKMKRVERRGTLEQQVANTNSLGSMASLHHASRTASHSAMQQPPAPTPATERPLQRSDTLLTHQSQVPGSNSQLSFARERPREDRDASLRSGMSSTNPGKNARTISPPPAIASLREDDEANAARSRSSSRNGRPGSKQQMTIPGKRSPLGTGVASGDGKDPSPVTKMEGDGETDADAEAEVDADAEGDGDHEEYEIEDDEDPQPLRKKGRDIMSVREAVRDPDEELFEAVEAAEANSTSSHTGARRYRDDD